MYFTTVKKGTKKAENMIDSYNFYTRRYGLLDLSDAYNSASVYKWRAWREIQDLCAQLGGRGLSVLGHNCMKYSAAFIANENGVDFLYYFTADYSYKIEM